MEETRGRRGSVYSMIMYEWAMDMNNSVGIDSGSETGGGEQRGKNWDNCNGITIKMIKK